VVPLAALVIEAGLAAVAFQTLRLFGEQLDEPHWTPTRTHKISVGSDNRSVLVEV
jgi:hypothetical protein